MAPLMLVHASSSNYRRSIEARGLEPRDPEWGGQPAGIYVTLEGNPPWFGTDLWTFPYLGPIERDPFFNDGVHLVVADPIPSDQLSRKDRHQ